MRGRAHVSGPRADKSAMLPLPPGNRVQARWKGDQKAGYFRDVVVADNGNGTFHIRWRKWRWDVTRSW